VILDPNKTNEPCCENRQLFPSLYIPVQIQGGPLEIPGARGGQAMGFGAAQAICVNCKTEWAVITSPEGFDFARLKTPKERLIL